VNRFAGNHVLVPILSRLMPRGARLRGGAVGAGVRVLVLLAAAPILFGLRASARIGRGDAGAAVQNVPALVALPALHVVQAYRLAAEVRSHARAHAIGDAAVPACDGTADLLGCSRPARAVSRFARHCDAIVARGYDATAPPRLS
jgi:hypothetical protein